MANISNLSSFLTDVADAIREKKGTQDQIPAENFDTEIKSIETGTKINNQDKDITKNGTYTADEGYTGLGTVVVNVPQTGDVPIKLFKTKEEMNSSTGSKEGDLAVVYREEIQPVTEESEFDSCTFPNTVVLKEAFTGNIYGGFRAVDHSVMFDGMVEMSSSRFRFNGWSENSQVRVEYTSQDGITYTRTDGGEELQEFGTTIKWEPYEEFNNVIGNFMQIGESVFEGIYAYKNNSWKLAPTQLTATSGYVYKQLLFYGKNGVESGTLGTPDNSFADTTAKAVYEIQNQYENMEPRILTDTDKTINKNIYFIPVKRDGTPLLDTSDVTNMQNMFYGCENLTTIPLLDTSSATNMGQMFNGCTNLITIPLLDTGDATNMAQMFLNCTNLATIPLLDTSSATNMGQMFNGCKNLTTIPLLDTSKAIYMEKMFYGCENLTTIPLLDTNSATNMNWMFNGCKNLTTIPELNTSKVPNMSGMFHRCENLTTIPLLDTSSTTNMSDMFSSCKNLTTIPELNTSNVTTMNSMFAYCENLTNIPLLDTSSVTDMNMMFNGCKNLTTIPELNTSKLTTMFNMFAYCENLTNIPLLNTSKVTSMSEMFNGCKNLTTIPLLDTSKVTSMFNMFNDCPNLTDDSLNIIMQMCINAVKITSNKTLKYIGLSSDQANKCKTLSNYSAFTSAGWTTGY